MIVVPTLRGFLISAARETLPEAPVFLKVFLAQDFGQDALTVEPAGTFLTTREVSLVCFLVEFAKVKASVTTDLGRELRRRPTRRARSEAPAAGGGRGAGRR